MSLVVISQANVLLDIIDNLLSIFSVDPSFVKPVILLSTIPFILFFFYHRVSESWRKRDIGVDTFDLIFTTDSSFTTDSQITHNHNGVVYQPTFRHRYQPGGGKQLVYRDYHHLRHEQLHGVQVNPGQHIGLAPELEDGTYEEYRFLYV